MSKIKTALVLEGGGAKGAFEAGIIKHISERKIKIDLVTGTSVGGLNAACFAFGKIAELLKVWNSINADKVYKPGEMAEAALAIYQFTKSTGLAQVLQTPNLIKELWEGFGAVSDILEIPSFLDNSPLENVLTGLFGDAIIKDAATSLLLTAYNLEDGHVEYFEPKSNIRVVDALMATSAIQTVFPPRVINKKHYVDGGNGENLPIRAAILHGCNHLIVARANAPEAEKIDTFSSWTNVALRTYFSRLNNLTTSAIAWANDISMRLKRENDKDLQICEIISDEVKDPILKNQILEKINNIPRVFSGEQPYTIIEITPEWAPFVLDFNTTNAQKLIEHGYNKAVEALENIDWPGTIVS